MWIVFKVHEDAPAPEVEVDAVHANAEMLNALEQISLKKRTGQLQSVNSNLFQNVGKVEIACLMKSGGWTDRWTTRWRL